MDNSQQQANQLQEKKEERIDELDIVGGALVKFVMSIFTKIKRILSPKSAE